jgi:hypothetical protein
VSRKRSSAVILAAVGVLGFLLILPCLQPKIRDGEGWVHSAARAKEIGYALHSYYDVNGELPPAVVRDKDGRPLYSWRVALLPYVERQDLYRRFRLDEPWDSPHNKPLSDETPKCYRPVFGGDDEAGLTRYQVLVGLGTAFERPGLTWADFPDGLANTILVVEAGEPVPWAKPVDVAYDPAGPLPRFGAGYTKPVHFLCREVNRHPGFVACFADGSVRFIRSSTDEGTLRAVITRNGGEVDVAGLE